MVKILLASRHGGHATRTHLIKEVIEEDYEKPEYIVTTDYKDDYEYNDKKYRVPSFRSTNSNFYNPIKALKNLYNSVKIIKKEKLGVVVCYGANTSIFLGLLASLTSADLITVESENRTEEPSISPRVLSFFGAEVWVSHDQMLDKYPKDKVINKGIIQRRSYEEYDSDKKEGVLVIPSSADEELMEKWRHRPHDELLKEMGETELIVTRAGMAAYEATHLAEKVIVNPYDHVHQKNFAEWLDKEYDNVKFEEEKSFKELYEEYSED